LFFFYFAIFPFLRILPALSLAKNFSGGARTCQATDAKKSANNKNKAKDHANWKRKAHCAVFVFH
jgi:hypothetical protein